jgi:hypothetical protein
VKNYESPLRDLARKIRDVARAHPAAAQAASFMNHVNDHLNALARIEEFNRRENDERQARSIAYDPRDHAR